MNYIPKVNAKQVIKVQDVDKYILICKSIHNILHGKSKLQNNICGMVSFMSKEVFNYVSMYSQLYFICMENTWKDTSKLFMAMTSRDWDLGEE